MSEVLWYLPNNTITVSAQATFLYIEFANGAFCDLSPISPGPMG